MVILTRTFFMSICLVPAGESPSGPSTQQDELSPEPDTADNQQIVVPRSASASSLAVAQPEMPSLAQQPAQPEETPGPAPIAEPALGARQLQAREAEARAAAEVCARHERFNPDACICPPLLLPTHSRAAVRKMLSICCWMTPCPFLTSVSRLRDSNRRSRSSKPR